MSLDLIYITNSPEVALIAEEAGVNYIMIDLETIGKEERQKGMNTVKSHHMISDVARISGVLSSSKTLVRINPWHEESSAEIESAISNGADTIMLPMWKTFSEVDAFLKRVNKRARTMLLLETKEAVEIVDEVLKHPLLDEIHIGLNDLHLSYGLTFMFELLSNGTVEQLCKKMKAAGIPYGFGGVARLGEGMLPAERVIMEHYRLGSTRVILSRSFCDIQKTTDIAEIEMMFSTNMRKLREFEERVKKLDSSALAENAECVKQCITEIVRSWK